MKIGIMQPYFFPYIGYWQLIQAVDRFVIFDDVNYIKGGWINRNYVLVGGKRALITLETRGASPNQLINAVQVGGNRGKLLKTLTQNYSKAPCYAQNFPLIRALLEHEECNLAAYLIHIIREVCKFLNIRAEILVSSDLPKDSTLKGQDKVISICQMLGAEWYINAIGGRELYQPGRFSQSSIQLRFLQSESVSYRQFGQDFEPWLSIIDILMFNPLQTIQDMLSRYQLVL